MLVTAKCRELGTLFMIKNFAFTLMFLEAINFVTIAQIIM